MTNGITNMLGSVPEWCAVVIELLGITIITAVAIYALLHGGLRLIKGDALNEIQQQVRQRLGRGILLALVVLIRTFLSFTLELELTGKWPWQQAGTETK